MTEENTVQHLIGLNLDEARETLQGDAVLRVLPLAIVETAPPQRPQFSARTQSARAAKKAAASTRAPHREHNFGELRVLRARRADATLELLVAREILRDEADAPAALSVD
jgi:hypothetical protein